MNEVSDLYFKTIIFHVTPHGPQLYTQGFLAEGGRGGRATEEQTKSNMLSAVTFLFFYEI